jgi:hypothetical protein
MTREELAAELRLNLHDLQDKVHQTEALRSFVDQGLLTEDEAIEDRVSLIYLLLQKSETISDLIDEFLDSSLGDRELVDKANRLVSEAKLEIARFQENQVLEELREVSDQTYTVQ